MLLFVEGEGRKWNPRATRQHRITRHEPGDTAIDRGQYSGYQSIQSGGEGEDNVDDTNGGDLGWGSKEEGRITAMNSSRTKRSVFREDF